MLEMEAGRVSVKRIIDHVFGDRISVIMKLMLLSIKGKPPDWTDHGVRLVIGLSISYAIVSFRDF